MTKMFGITLPFFFVSATLFAQQTSGPSLNETFEWMTNTLKPSEGNGLLIHRPSNDVSVTGKPDLYVKEAITEFEHDACSVTVKYDWVENDINVAGMQNTVHYVDTFNLKDIGPDSILIPDMCSDPSLWNCEDRQGHYVRFKPTNARPLIHEHSSAEGGRSWYGATDQRGQELDQLCKKFPKNLAYCGFPLEDAPQPLELKVLDIGFSTPAYAKRFEKAFKHAVILCGGKPSAF
jgi:hypothetical protein